MDCKTDLNSIQLCRIVHFGRLHSNTVKAYLSTDHIKEIHVQNQEADGEIVCLSGANLHDIDMLLKKEKRESFTLLVGDNDTYVMLDDRDAGKRIWKLDEIQIHLSQTPSGRQAAISVACASTW